MRGGPRAQLAHQARLLLLCRLSTLPAAMAYEWDADKSRANLRKHAVTFEEASTVFGDAAAQVTPDDIHSASEARLTMIGLSAAGRLLLVVYTMRGQSTRIISARRATHRETKRYEGHDIQ